MHVVTRLVLHIMLQVGNAALSIAVTLITVLRFNLIFDTYVQGNSPLLLLPPPPLALQPLLPLPMPS